MWYNFNLVFPKIQEERFWNGIKFRNLHKVFTYNSFNRLHNRFLVPCHLSNKYFPTWENTKYLNKENLSRYFIQKYDKIIWNISNNMKLFRIFKAIQGVTLFLKSIITYTIEKWQQKYIIIILHKRFELYYCLISKISRQHSEKCKNSNTIKWLRFSNFNTFEIIWMIFRRLVFAFPKIYEFIYNYHNYHNKKKLWWGQSTFFQLHKRRCLSCIIY